MSFDLPDNANEIQGIGAVELPFVAPLMYWRSGVEALKNMEEIKGVQRFGGWAIQPDQIEPYTALPKLPPAFEKIKLSGSEGNYENYLTRNVDVAVIARRFAWFDKSVTQYLCFLRDFGAVVLQAKSTTGKDLDNAFSEFKKKSVEARFNQSTQSTVADNFFYAPIGSFGDTPVFVEKKGKRDSTMVTIPIAFTPANGWTGQNIQYVGKEVASEILRMQKLAKPWLDDWNNRRSEKPQAENSLPPMPDTSEEFPFG